MSVVKNMTAKNYFDIMNKLDDSNERYGVFCVADKDADLTLKEKSFLIDCIAGDYITAYYCRTYTEDMRCNVERHLVTLYTDIADVNEAIEVCEKNYGASTLTVEVIEYAPSFTEAFEFFTKNR